jgi:hypothetical protein
MNPFKPFSFCILFFVLTFSATAQKVETSITYLSTIPDPGNDYVVYDRQRKLTIDDFKATPDPANAAVAITTSGFMFKAGYRKEEGKATLLISVYCSFDKQLSWLKEKGKNPYILSHEQLHFDISYIGTLLFMKKVQQSTFKQEGYMDQLRAIYQQAVDNMEQLQHQYDTETNNGINTGKQAEWGLKIQEQLALLQKTAR